LLKKQKKVHCTLGWLFIALWSIAFLVISYYNGG
jgi:hypothetical protein